MIELLLQILTIALALFGLTEIIRIIALYILAPISKQKTARVICLGADTDEGDLAAEAERLRWCRFEGENRVFALDCGIPPEKKPMLLYRANNCPEIILCTPEEFMTWVHSTKN